MSEAPWKRFERKIETLLVQRYGEGAAKRIGYMQQAGAAKAGGDIVLLDRYWLELRKAQDERIASKLIQACSDAWIYAERQKRPKLIPWALTSKSGSAVITVSTQLCELGAIFGRPAPEPNSRTDADRAIVSFVWNQWLRVVDALERKEEVLGYGD